MRKSAKVILHSKVVSDFNSFHQLSSTVYAADFSYDVNDPFGPGNWSKINNNCAGTRQSPIDIVTSSVRNAEESIPLKIFNSDVVCDSVFVKNTGHGADVQLGFAFGIKIAFYGGPLRHPYIFHSFHVHWPAEHTVDGRRYDAELHIVNYNSIYGSFENATKHSDGLAVFGIFFELDTTVLTSHKFVDILRNSRFPATTFTTTSKKNMFCLTDVIGSKPNYVFSYLGSLTTPSCSEVVTWMVRMRMMSTTKLKRRN